MNEEKQAKSTGTLSTVLFLAGLALIAFGAWMWFRPLGPIVGGVELLGVVFLREYEQMRDERMRNGGGGE